MVTSYGYDSRHRVQSITHRQGEQGPVLAQYIYGYDAKGQRTSATETEGDLVRERRYDYDVLDRLIRETLQFTDTEGQAQAVERTYRYDSVGNRTEAEVRILQAGAVVRHEVTTATYDANSRLTREQVQDQRTGAVTIRDYAYDANGSPVSVSENGVTTTYAYDGDNRLTALSARGTAAAYGYDADGNRIAKTVNGQHTRFALDTSQPYVQVLEATDSQGRQRRVTHGLGPVAERHEGQTRWVLKDVQQSSRVLINAAAQAEASLVYTAFGEAELGSATGVDWLHRYDGEQLDEETGDYYLRARYMRPGLGRFTQKDTWTGNPNNPLTLNQYLFADGNPVMKADPSGRFSLIESCIVQREQLNIADYQLRAGLSLMDRVFDFAADDDESGERGRQVDEGASPPWLVAATSFVTSLISGAATDNPQPQALVQVARGARHGHHTIPVYLCGADSEQRRRADLAPDIHYELHGKLYRASASINIAGRIWELTFRKRKNKHQLNFTQKVARYRIGRAAILAGLEEFYRDNDYFPKGQPVSVRAAFMEESPFYLSGARTSLSNNCSR